MFKIKKTVKIVIIKNQSREFFLSVTYALFYAIQPTIKGGRLTELVTFCAENTF